MSAASQLPSWQLQAALDATEDALVALDQSSQVVLVNRKFAELVDATPTQLLGVSSEDLNRRFQPLLKTATDALITASDQAQPWVRTHLQCKDGRILERSCSEPHLQTASLTAIRIWTFRNVTHTLKADELHTRLAAVVEYSDDAIISTTLEGFITTWNKAAERLYGYPAEKIIGRHVTVLLPYDRRNEEEAILAKLNRGEHVEHYETRRLRHDGQVVDVSLTVSLVRDEHGVVYGTSKIARDISDRKRSEQRLEDRNEWFGSILDSIGDAVIAVDVDGYVSYINRVAQALTGCSSDAVQDQRIDAVLSLVDESNGAQLNPIEAVLRTGQAVSSSNVMVLISNDGLRLSVEHSATPIRRPSGELLGAVMVFRDISERRRKELALAQGEQRLRLINDVIPQMLWIADAQGNTEYFNERWDDYVGAPRPGSTESPRPAALHPDDHDATLRAWRHSIATGEPFEVEYRLRRFDGEYRWFVARAVPLRNECGEIESWYGSSTDIHQHKLVVEALHEEYLITEQLNAVGKALASELDLRKLVQIITDAGTRICGAEFGAFFYKVNDGAEPALMLFTASGLNDVSVDHLRMPRAHQLVESLFMGKDMVRSHDIRDQRYGDNPLLDALADHVQVVSYLGVPVLARNGDVLGVLMFSHSQPGVFSERDEKIIAGVAAQATAAIENAKLYELAQQSAEERKYLLESERAARNAAVRMSEMKDQFLATVSHELRTPLSAIMGWVHVLRRGANKPGDKERALDTIERNGRMQTKLIEDLLDMSRIISGKLRLDIQTVDPLLVIDAALETIRPAADAKSITISTALDPEIKSISADASRLQQVLWNLLSNAVKFTPREGSVHVALLRTATQIELSVIDSGMGIPAEFLPHVFERFRQADASMTRSVGGLGLGLAIVKQLVELHGGTIEASSQGKNAGATFTVKLPIASNALRGLSEIYRTEETQLEKISDFKPMDLQGVRVAVIDDERDASELVHRILEDCGATVFSTNVIDEALKFIEQERPHLFISDIGMPGMDGFELLRQVRALSPDRGGKVPVIALTAFARVEDRIRAMDAGFAAHLAKPIEPAELIAMVARVVGQPVVA